jgi:cytochrome c biogenesis protein CcmG/thiol:disulfide interchange protein DsbE
MSDTTYPKASKSTRVSRVSKAPGAPKASVQPADDYEYDDAEYDEYDEPYVNEYDEYDEEPGPGLLASPGRALILGISAVALLVVFAAVIWLMTSQPSRVTVIDGPAGGVPVIKGLVQTSEAQAPAKGAFAPDFMWTDSNNQNVALSSFRGDKPVFVNFWGTWCPPCRAEMPTMESFYQKHKDEIQMIGVSMGPRDDPATVLNFVKDANYSWKFVHDGDYKIAEKYQVGSVPSSYFIDRTGVIKAVQVGAMTDEKMIENYFQQVR